MASAYQWYWPMRETSTRVSDPAGGPIDNFAKTEIIIDKRRFVDSLTAGNAKAKTRPPGVKDSIMFIFWKTTAMQDRSVNRFSRTGWFSKWGYDSWVDPVWASMANDDGDVESEDDLDDDDDEKFDDEEDDPCDYDDDEGHEGDLFDDDDDDDEDDLFDDEDEAE